MDTRTYGRVGLALFRQWDNSRGARDILSRRRMGAGANSSYFNGRALA